MTPDFEKGFWQEHWDPSRTAPGGPDAGTANPYVIHETAELVPSSALDAGCGTGGEAIWLAARGWQVTGADISANALAEAAARATAAGVSDRVTWVEADLTVWEPESPFGLVVTNYAHASIPQLEFYDRIARWVAPGGTLLIVGHLNDDAQAAIGHGHDHGHDHDHGAKPGHGVLPGHGHDHGDQPPVEATATPSAITGQLDSTMWQVVTADTGTRTMNTPDGQTVTISDVFVRAIRLPRP
jgi:SAM-dependent methyltransferase